MIDHSIHDCSRFSKDSKSGPDLLPSLAIDLRVRTASLHKRAEALLGLPNSIAGRGEYVDWLGHFLAFYDPLERAIGAFSGWDILEPFPAESLHSRRLIRDLTVLGFDWRAVTHFPHAPCPEFPTIAQALGARYVLEGAALGGKVILRDLQARIGPQIAGATAFFGRGYSAPLSNWRDFKTAVDCFGQQNPKRRDDVLTGAEQTFRALLDWFEPFVAQRKSRTLFAPRGESLKSEMADLPTQMGPAGAMK